MPCDEVRALDKSVLRILLASAMLSLSPLAALAGKSTSHSALAGAYITRAPKTAPTMSVSLGEDGTATVTQDPGQGSITSFGHWVADGNQVKVTFNAEADAPPQPPMVFQPVHNKLQPVVWNHDAWGATQPPTLTKGYKVKYLFWTTTMR
jgi:hypothetical protein